MSCHHDAVGDAELNLEERLARAVLEGDERRAAAERELCEQLAPRLHLYAVRRLRTTADAADVTQETLAVVVDALRKGKVNDPSRIPQFALGTCRHLVSRVLRGERARLDLRHALDQPSTASPEPEVWRIDLRTLVGCFEKLADRDQRVVAMTFHDDCTADEIAAALGLTPANVRVIRHRALLQLRACVDGVGGAT
jgi:RNA polymerase sigma-70 factor, ECF subfamily